MTPTGDQPGDPPVEWFRPTSGRLVGPVGLVAVAAVVVLAFVGAPPAIAFPVAAGAALTGVLIWAAMLRPRVGLSASTLVLRNMLETVHIPLAAIEELVVRQFLAVRVGERRFVSPAVGHSLRTLMRSPRHQQQGSGLRPPVSDLKYPDLVEDRIRQAAEAARAAAGVMLLSDEQLALAAGVRREPAWAEIAAMVVLVVVFVAAVVL